MEPIADRTALFWCTTDELRLMRRMIGMSPHYVRTSETVIRPIDVKLADVDWALKICADLDKAKELEDRGKFEKALAKYQTILKTTGASDYILMRVGGCYANLGELHQALLHLEKAADLNPQNEQIRRLIDECRRLLPPR